MDTVFRKPLSFSGIAVGLAGVGLATFVLTELFPANSTTAGFIYLMVVLGIATWCGFRVSAIVSLCAMLCMNFWFLPPVGHFTIADPENWVALFAFLLTALVASHLSDRAQQEAAEARRRQRETEQLYALSRSIILTDPAQPIGTQAARFIAQIFESPMVALLDSRTGQLFRGGPEEAADVDTRLHDAVRLAAHHHDPTRNLDIWPISLGGSPVGALAAVGIRASDGAVQSILNLVAIALERVHTEDAANRAEVARRSEEFKSTLLDAVSHEFKTPLTSIKAAVTGLRALHQPLHPDQQELALIIEEETDRLSQLVTEAAKMSEIDAGKVKLHRASVPAADIIDAAFASFQSRGADRLQGDYRSADSVFVDNELIILALRQVIDNALKYSAPGTPIHCSTTNTSDRVQIRIANLGPGVPERDRERIFDKFYRRANSRNRVTGTGLGLHIAREIARIHGGDLWLDPDSPKGAVFCFSLPVARQASA